MSKRHDDNYKLLHNKHTPISHLPLPQGSHRILNPLLVEWPCHDGWFNIMIHTKLQHFPEFSPGGTSGTLDSAAIDDQLNHGNWLGAKADCERIHSPISSHDRQVPESL